MDLSIIIVNYKTAEKVKICVDSIKNSDMDGLDWEIIVVDNKSDDDIEEILNQYYPEVKLLRSDRNLGMGAGNNLGVREAAGNFILILNPDTQIKGNAVKMLYQYVKKNDEVGIVGPKLLNPDNTLQESCLRFPNFFTPIFRRTFLGALARKHLNKFLMRDFGHEETTEVDWLLGSCLMIDRRAFPERNKIFDEKFFMYFEDIDLCRRARNRNYKVVYHPRAVVIHDHVRQSAGAPWYLAPFTDRLAREHIKSWLKYFLLK